MNNQDQQNRQNSGGTGSAENRGDSRQDQQQNADQNESTRQNVSEQLGDESVPVSSVRDLGGLSGRDDASGGSGDDMENTSTNEPTERF